MAEAYSIVCRHHVLFTHGHLLMDYGCFCLLTLCIMLLWTLVYRSVLVLSILPILWDIIPGIKLMDCMVILLSFWRMTKLSHNGSVILHPHCQFRKVPVSPCLPQYLLFSIVLILVILMSVKWYLIVNLICTSLFTNDVEHLFICSVSYIWTLWEISIQILYV